MSLLPSSTGGAPENASPVFSISLLMLLSVAAQATDIPYQWRNVRIGGGGFVSGLVFDPTTAGVAYARTDVGGAYRWNAAISRWTPLTDWVDADHANLMGIDAMALDPSDTRRLYLVGGTYTRPGVGNAAMLRSGDRGDHFDSVALPFPMGGNELGRGNGERLAVDPHNGAVLLLGSRNAGLWRSADHGAHWAEVANFPAQAKTATATSGSRTQPVGIAFVTFDPSSRAVYAGISTRATSVFRSDDGGRSWAAVSGQPIGLRPTHMHPMGKRFVLTYGDEPGPDQMHDGAVIAFDPATSRWTDITPLPRTKNPSGYGWGDVAVDPRNPDVLMASTFAHYTPHDLLFRSTDGGKHWTEVFERSTFDHHHARWTVDHTPHWMASVAIDPFDPDHVLFVTGYGIWASRDMRALGRGRGVHWWFQDDGLEETVPLGLVSPSVGAHLISAVGDLDGFRHDNLDTAPLQLAGPPRYQNAEDIDVAGRAQAVMVRTGRIRGKVDMVRAAISRDGGITWKALASEPGEGDGAGTIAVSADGKRIAWLPVHAWHVFVTDDDGKHWRHGDALPGASHVLANRISANVFYADGAGKAWASTDGAITFVPVAGSFGARIAADRHPHAHLAIPPDRNDELWWVSPATGLVMGDAAGHLLDTPTDIAVADSLGFGRAAPGMAYATMYLAGKQGSVRGLFRSVDHGAHWQRINDDAHQFGAMGHVTGDPRVFGRVYFATGGRGIFYGDPKPAKGKSP
ncbi:cellulase [Pinirhizobacter sp.]|jgi:hypothetical protein|uniref:WD40/YVTN/BNR-like repeat-containing protein n=1 Tax=Pinirhizobacter sp. TaxID=2950432 RepID=UPI002F3F1337